MITIQQAEMALSYALDSEIDPGPGVGPIVALKKAFRRNLELLGDLGAEAGAAEPTDGRDAGPPTGSSGHQVAQYPAQDPAVIEYGDLNGSPVLSVTLNDGCADDAAKDHLDQLAVAFALYIERRAERAEVWERSGLKGQVFHLMAKAERAFEQAMHGDDINPDHFIDIINYAVFALRLIDNPNGAWNW